MELRGCSHFHYIQAIKAGLIKKVLNVNSRGKPAVTFKKVTDIYGTLNDIGHKSLPALWSKDGLELTNPDMVQFKVENPRVLYAERKLVKEEPEVSDCDSVGDTDEEQSVVEDDSLTLVQLMQRCKKRKSSQLKSVESSKGRLGTCSKQELYHSSLLSDEDDCDLNVALSIWKSQLSKRKKIKTKCQGSSTISQRVQIIGKSDPINSNQDALPPSSDLPIPVDIKVEIPDTGVTDNQNVNGCRETLPLYAENVNFHLSPEPVGADELFFNRELTSRNETQLCVLNSACHENLKFESYVSEPFEMVRASSTEDMDKDNLDAHKPHNSYFPASETAEGQSDTSYVSNDGITEAISLTVEEPCDTNISLGETSTDENEITSQNICEVLTHLHGMTNLPSLHLTEMSHGAEVCFTKYDYKDELTLDQETSISAHSTADCSSSPEQLLLSGDKSPAKEKQFQTSDCSDIERISPPDFLLCDYINEFNPFQDPKHPPARLLSTRTTISPKAQERLSKSLESMQIHEQEFKTCGGELYLKQTKKVGTTEESDRMKRVEFDINHDQNIRKSKKRSFNSISHIRVPHASTRGTAFQSGSDSVIAFTQRQMQDIECVAVKLTNQLKSMKAIVEDRLHVEGNKATSFKFNMDEVRTAITDANKVEASARKLLSMMTRDCSRFCKIMKITENDSTASQSVIHKVKKKIKFADEAGGKLCHIRLIEDDVEAFKELNSEKYEMVK